MYLFTKIQPSSKIDEGYIFYKYYKFVLSLCHMICYSLQITDVMHIERFIYCHSTVEYRIRNSSSFTSAGTSHVCIVFFCFFFLWTFKFVDFTSLCNFFVLFRRIFECSNCIFIRFARIVLECKPMLFPFVMAC